MEKTPHALAESAISPFDRLENRSERKDFGYCLSYTAKLLNFLPSALVPLM